MFKIIGTRDQSNGSAGRTACCQAYQPEFHCQDAHGSTMELTPTSCSLTSVCAHMHTTSKQANKQMLWIIQKRLERSKTPKFVSLPKPFPAIWERKGQLIKQPGDMVQVHPTLSLMAREIQ